MSGTQQRIKDSQHAPWVDRGRVSGGFVLMESCAFVRCWAAYRAGGVRLRDVRTWLGVVEMVERRRAHGPGREPAYDERELSRLTGDPDHRKSLASVRRLVRAGVVEWSRERVALRVCSERAALRRLVPMPRRMVRWLARHGNASDVATAFGHAARCLFYKSQERRCASGGTCAAGWVAERFGVGERSVKRSRAKLLGLGWLRAVDDGRKGWRRGCRFTVELDWQDPDRVEMAPHKVGSETGLAPPEKEQDPPSEKKQPEPVPAGVGLRPDLNDVSRADLRSAERLFELYSQACGRGWVRRGEAGALSVFAAAARARRCGERNPPGMFVSILRRGLWSHITAMDEDAALRRFRTVAWRLTRRTRRPGRKSSTQLTRREIRELVRAAKVEVAGPTSDPITACLTEVSSHNDGYGLPRRPDCGTLLRERQASFREDEQAMSWSREGDV